jgi:2-oxoglutarate dehydrogenase E2 component (dihydrolipoamide succinyltransferase)
MATEHGLDLGRITGTGLEGRITKMDVQAYLGRQDSAPQPAQAPAPVPAPGVSEPPVPGDLIRLTKIRRMIAEHMVGSKRTSPHVTTVMEADLSKVVAHRASHKPVYAREGVNLTYTAYFIAAIAAALKFHPEVNSSWTDEGIRLHREINVGMATALDGGDGLIVPVIKGADRLSLLGIARQINDLAQRARNRNLQPDEVRGGTFTLTNHGISGSLFATPIINQPQCGILGVGAMEKRVVVIDDAIAIRPMVYISLTFDHRILDGANADHFLARVKANLESWNA